MHPFLILGALLHATAFAVIGFFVLFAASRSQGLLKAIGNILGAWLFILAVIAVICAGLATRFGGGPLGYRMMGDYRHPWMQPGRPFGDQPSPAAPGSASPAASANK